MTIPDTNFRNKNFRRVVIACVSVSLVLAVGILVQCAIAKLRDTADRAT